MEQMIKDWCDRHGITLDSTSCARLIGHARLVYEAGRTFNLTGHRSAEDILADLSLGSLSPVAGLDVPRGTLVADMGTGGGFPGIPFAVLHGGARVVLFDSNGKKCDFLERAIASLGLDNVSVECQRIEAAGRDPRFRTKFDMVITRAMAHHYVSIETGAPLLAGGGLLYLYSRDEMCSLDPGILEHAGSLGLSGVSPEERNMRGFSGEGLLFEKTGETPERYPRNYPVIRREAARFGEE